MGSATIYLTGASTIQQTTKRGDSKASKTSERVRKTARDIVRTVQGSGTRRQGENISGLKCQIALARKRKLTGE